MVGYRSNKGNALAFQQRLQDLYGGLVHLVEGDVADPEVNLAGARQKVTIKQGLEQPVSKQIIAAIKAAKLKVEAQIHGDKLRISGKKRDDLQLAMALLRKTEVEVPLQFENFRD